MRINLDVTSIGLQELGRPVTIYHARLSLRNWVQELMPSTTTIHEQGPSPSKLSRDGLDRWHRCIHGSV